MENIKIYEVAYAKGCRYHKQLVETARTEAEIRSWFLTEQKVMA